MRERVFLLGSGFSRAVGPGMPLLADLSKAVVELLSTRVPGRTPLSAIPGQGTPLERDFERWLSFLVDAPPWLSESEQLRNAAAFAEVSWAASEALRVMQLATACEDPPAWLLDLVRFWQSTNATVITFNYDVLIELAWLTVTPASPDRSWQWLYPAPISPAAARVSAVFGGDVPAAGMRLLKLHGSLNWYYSGTGSSPADQVFDVGVKGPWSPDGPLPFYDDSERLVADKVPLIVPPTAVKTAFYSNHILANLWRQAGDALWSADELVVMGFSLPASDQLVSSMLSTSLDPDAIVVLVDVSDDCATRFAGVIGDDLTSPDSRVEMAFIRPHNPIDAWVQTCAGS